MEGTPITTKSLVTYERSLADVKDWLLTRLDRATFLTDCTLRSDVERISVEERKATDPEARRLTLASTAGEALASALVRYLSGCVCAALLPPCPSCDDTAVLLATVEVEECDVTHVCNLERRIPLTGTALRYWVPVEHVARLLDKACCEMPREWSMKEPPAQEPPKVPAPVGEPSAEEPPAEKPEPPEVVVNRARAGEPVYARPADQPRVVATARSLLRTAGLPTDQTERLSRAVSRLNVRELVRTTTGEAPSQPVQPEAPRAEAPAAPEAPSKADVEEVAAKAAADATKALRRDLGTLKRQVTSLKEQNRALAKQVKTLGAGG